MRETDWKTILAYAIGAVIILPMLLPVLDNIREGQRLIELGLLSAEDRLRPVGLGPVSGLMVYLFATPVVVAMARTFWGKLAGLAGMVAVSQVVSHVTSVFERGDIALGLGLVALSGTAGFVAYWVLRRRQRQRTAVMEQAARALSVRVGAAARKARGVAWSDTTATGSDAPNDSSVIDVVEKMVLGAIWQAVKGGPADTFERRVRRGLIEIRRDLEGNPLLDPTGKGRAMVDHVLAGTRLAAPTSFSGAGTDPRVTGQRSGSGNAPSGPTVTPAASAPVSTRSAA